MSKFEQELAEAIEHGCPECESKLLTLYQWVEERFYLSLMANGKVSYGWPDGVSVVEPKPKEVECQDCYQVLWWSEDGWVESLRKVVESDEV